MSPAEARRTLADVVRAVDGLLTRPSVVALGSVAAWKHTHTHTHSTITPLCLVFDGNVMHQCVCVFLWLSNVMSSSFLEQNWFETIATLVFHWVGQQFLNTSVI